MAGSGGAYSMVKSVPVHLCFFLVVLLTFLGLSWYVKYEPTINIGLLVELVKLVLMVSPLLLLLALHLLSALDDGRRFPPYLLLPKRDSGGTPWGVAFLLVFLLFMLSFQSYLRETLFPMLA